MKTSTPLVCCLSHYLTGLFAPGLTPASFRTRAAYLLRDLVDCQVVCFAELRRDTRQMDVDFDPYSPELNAALEGFGRHMAQYPCFNFDPDVAGGRPFLRGDFLSDEEFYASPIYQEGFQLANISDHAAIPMPAPEEVIFFIGLEKRDGHTFRPAHRDTLVLLQPHLVNACQLARALVPLEEPFGSLAALRYAGLSPREAEILALIATGKSNAEIATILALRLSTIKGHVVTIFNKLGVDNRHAAMLRAHELVRPSAPPAAPTTHRASTIAPA